jgi:hypothetical protein
VAAVVVAQHEAATPRAGRLSGEAAMILPLLDQTGSAS